MRKSCLRAFVVVEDVAGEGDVGEARCFASLGNFEALALSVEHQLGVFDEGHAVGVGELLSAGADEVDVGAFFQHQPRGLDGVAKALDTGHTAGLHAAAVHQQGIELNAAIGGEETAAAGIEGGVVFEDSDGGFDGVEGRAAASEDPVAGLQRVAYACLVGSCRVGRDGPGASVDEQNGSVCGRGRHRTIVEHCAAPLPIPSWGAGMYRFGWRVKRLRFYFYISD